LSRTGDHALAKYFAPEQTMHRDPNYTFLFSRLAGWSVRASDSEYVMNLQRDWAFGAGNHAVTFVSRLREDLYLEHAFSYYSDTKTLDITPGHEMIKPTSIYQAVGLPYPVADPNVGITNCFRCHSTGDISVSASSGVEPKETGVRCEVCHGPGRAHRDAALRGTKDVRLLIEVPGRSSSQELTELCGNCHRFPGKPDAIIDWSYSWNVRHQPPYFRQSRCFQQSKTTFSCLTCHNPHDPVRLNDSLFYNQKCAECHTIQSHAPAQVCFTEAPSDCVRCHMPRVKVSPHLTFVNHWIGVYQNGATLQPNGPRH
jgi:hypothetical protein